MMKTKIYIIVITIVSLLVMIGCSQTQSEELEGDNGANTDNNEPKNLATFSSIEFDKSSYLIGSSARATININNDGDSFYGLILLKMSREGFSRNQDTYIYSRYPNTLIDKDASFNKPIAFAYTDKHISKPSETSVFRNEGKHNYEFYLFDCNAIEAEFDKDCYKIRFGTGISKDGIPSSEPLDMMSLSIDVE